MAVSLVGVSPNLLKSFCAHCHDEWEIILNLEGEGVTIIDGHEFPFCPGTVTCHPPGAPHSKSSDSSFKDIYIRASDFPAPFDRSRPIFSDDAEKSFESLMFLALRIFHKKEANYTFILNSLFDAMCQILLSKNENHPMNEDVEKMKNEMIENFTNPEFRISHSLDKTLYCNDYFRRLFKKETGVSPIAYLTGLRLEHAKKLLSQNHSHINTTISSISLLSGFYDPHYFARVFKNNVGLTPREYMEKKKKTNI